MRRRDSCRNCYPPLNETFTSFSHKSRKDAGVLAAARTVRPVLYQRVMRDIRSLPMWTLIARIFLALPVVQNNDSLLPRQPWKESKRTAPH
jgi:hypothetical protein